MTLAAWEHQKTNRQIKVTRITVRTIAHSIMAHARVLEGCNNFALMYTIDHIFRVLSIKYLIKGDSDPTTPFKLATGTKPSVSHLSVLFCPYVVRKVTAHVDKKALNMRQKSQKGFHGIFVGILQH